MILELDIPQPRHVQAAIQGEEEEREGIVGGADSGIEIKIGHWSSDAQILILRVVLDQRKHQSFLDHRNKIGE